MLRNIAANKAAVGPLNTSKDKTITVLTPKAELWQPIPKSNNCKSCLRLKILLYLIISYYQTPRDLL